MNLHVTMYKYTNKPIIVDKSSYLGTGLTITSDNMGAAQDMENPEALLHFDSEPDYNYAYIQEYHRYYYVTNKTWVGGNVWSFTFHVDELFTYKAVVADIEGLVAYSASGLEYKYDPRLNYNVPPTRFKLNPAAGVDTSGGVPYVLLRYYNMDMKYTLLDMELAPTMMNCVYMNAQAYNGFLDSYLSLWSSNEQLAYAIGRCIIDVTYVHYIGGFPASVTSDTDIVFNSPSVMRLNNKNAKTLKAEIQGYASLCKAYQCNPYTSAKPNGLTYQFTDTWMYYWQRTAKRKLNLPWVGTIELNIDQMGWGKGLQGTFSVQVCHEPLENSYVISLGYGTPVSWYYETRVVSSVTTSLAFPIDDSYNNMMQTQNVRALSLIAQGAVTGAAIGLGSSRGLMMAGNFVSNLGGFMLEMENLKVQDATSLTYKGVSGGYMDLANPGGNYVYLEILTTEPADNYADFWADHGKPDGARRALSSLTGYVQMQEFEMIYDANATKGEMDRLEAQLYQGVIL